MWDVTGSTVKIIGQLGFLLTHPVWDVTMTGGIDVNRLTGFLLTHPVWDVTGVEYDKVFYTDNFYSHIPCGM